MVVFKIAAYVTVDRENPYSIVMMYPSLGTMRIQISSIEVHWTAQMHSAPPGNFVDANVRLTAVLPDNPAAYATYLGQVEGGTLIGWIRSMEGGTVLLDEHGYVCATDDWLKNAPAKWIGKTRCEPFLYYDVDGSMQAPNLLITSDIAPTSSIGIWVSIICTYQVITAYDVQSLASTKMISAEVVRGNTYEENPFSNMDVESFRPEPKPPKPLIEHVKEASRKTTTSIILD
jgi:hypothetical protein